MSTTEKKALPARIIMRYQDIGLLYGTHIGTRQGQRKHLVAVRDAIGKKPHQKLTIYEYAEYEGIPIQALIDLVNAHP